ncbi:MAG: stage III sporulation protein AC [Clostridia bacterium]|jgi:stage III sporulation protein AC|nr:stage III sporulation protein AC [Clostridia bacterium]MBQ2325478.1 stage III sporulation protein AC [Clostridia bacterium]MBR6776321.1 stage III sporulation protein AC [Clostridia bacterium]
MNVTLIIKIAGVGLLASIACQILQKSGKDEQATFVSIAGVITVMIMLISEISQLFSSIRSIFGL